MVSWREAASPQAQDDLDELTTTVLKHAQETISGRGGLSPFGAAVTTTGHVTLVAPDPGIADYAEPEEVLGMLHETARASAGEWRAVAFGADVWADGADAVHVELEHRDGLALVLVVPYSHSMYQATVSFGEMTGGIGQHKIWTRE